MRCLQLLLIRHIRCWPLIAIVVGVLTLNLAAQRSPGTDRRVVTAAQWEYKTVGFRMTLGDDMARMQTAFAGILNREAAGGWEFAGRCLHVDGEDYWVDYVVFRRTKS